MSRNQPPRGEPWAESRCARPELWCLAAESEVAKVSPKYMFFFSFFFFFLHDMLYITIDFLWSKVPYLSSWIFNHEQQSGLSAESPNTNPLTLVIPISIYSKNKAKLSLRSFSGLSASWHQRHGQVANAYGRQKKLWHQGWHMVDLLLIKCNDLQARSNMQKHIEKSSMHPEFGLFLCLFAAVKLLVVVSFVSLWTVRCKINASMARSKHCSSVCLN